MSKKTKKLFRIDAKISYLYLTYEANYNVKDFLRWLKNDMHSGEIDESSALEIKEVKSTTQIQDYLDRDNDYMVYDDTGSDDIQYISALVEELALDSEVLAERLRSLGYTVTAPAKAAATNTAKRSKKGGAE